MATNASAIRAGRAFVELFAEDKRLVRGLKAAQRKLQAWGASVTAMGRRLFAAGAALAGPLLGAATYFARAGDALDKMSHRVGASVEFLSKLGYAAELGGTSIEAMETGIRRMQRTAYDAANGSSTAARAFQDLGVSVADAGGNLKSTEQLFIESAAALSKIENNTHKAALATIIFGRAGTQLLPMLQRRGELLDKMAEAETLGLVMSTEDAQAAADLTDAMTRLWKSLKMAAAQIGAAVAPLLTELANRVARAGRYVIDLVKNNRELIATAFKIAAGVMAAGVALMAAGGILTGLGMAVGVVIKGFLMLKAALAVGAAIVGVLLTPVGALAAGVVALGAYLMKTSGLADRALKWLADSFRQLWEEATASFQGIADALAAGDLALAGQVLWASLKLQWQKGVAAVNKLWEDAKWYFFATWQEATSWLAEKFIEVWAGLKAGFVQTVAFLTKTWHGFVLFAGNAWNTAQKQVGNVFLDLLGKLGVLSEQEVGWAKEDMGRELDTKMADRTRERTAAMAEAEAERQKDLERIRSERTGALAALEDDKRRYYDKLNAAYDADLASAQGALDAAKAEWESSLEAAREARAARDALSPGERPEFDPFDGLGAALQKVTTAGTFSAFGARGLAAGGPEERTARATEETARNTKRLLDAARDGGLAFD